MLNLFRKGDEPLPVCAVPDGGALPRFLHGDGWTFVGKVDDIAEQLLETDRATYRAVIQEVGYYIYAPL